MGVGLATMGSNKVKVRIPLNSRDPYSKMLAFGNTLREAWRGRGWSLAVGEHRGICEKEN